MLNKVENRFNWINLDILRSTGWHWNLNDQNYDDWQTWIITFQKEHANMEEYLKKLINQHRKKLITEKNPLRAEQIRRLSPKMEEQVSEGLMSRPDKKYIINECVLTSDTIENQYMKFILNQTINSINTIYDTVKRNEKYSEIFKTRISEWANDWMRIKENRFWKGISRFKGMRKKSLILSQDPLYAGILRSWYKLNTGFKLFDQDVIHGGIQNIAQLYEIWCFVKMDELITEILGKNIKKESEIIFNKQSPQDEEIPNRTISLKYYHPNNDKVLIELIFQAHTTSNAKNESVWKNIVSIPNVQTPDIVLRLHRKDLPHSPVYTWIFDAKYRIDTNNKAPKGAINQMHRYRDAILWTNEIQGANKPYKHESLGAFVLFPGNEEEIQNESQIKSIDQVNIGAYFLTPNKEIKLLRKKLEELLKIDVIEIANNYMTINETLKDVQGKYLKNVPLSSLTTSKGIIAKCITKPDTPENMNTPAYWEHCRLYRLPVKQYPEFPDKWDFIVPVLDRQKNEVAGLFVILNVKKMKRKDIAQAYKKLYNIDIPEDRSKESNEYWLFYLRDKLDIPANLNKLPPGKVVKVEEL